MTASQIIVLATPVFFALIALELAWGLAKRRNTYRAADALNSISLGVLSQISAVFTRVLRVGIYSAVFLHASLVPIKEASAFWNTWYGWVLALVFYDFCYYWLHRAGHEVALFWAAHVAHHQSQEFNLSTALRQTSTGALFGWVFYLPMALAGVPPSVFAVVALVDLLYQYWVHTEHVGKLGWFDRWFCSPSNHRVHHAVNDGYLDKNYGGILIIWDRLFGSFREEGERCVYGTRKPLNSWDPLWANAEVYWGLLQTSWRTARWADKLRVWFKPPGWLPPDLAARSNAPAFSVQRVSLYQPPVSRTALWVAGALFFVVLQGTTAFLWTAETLTLERAALWFGVITLGLWVVGALSQGRIQIATALMVCTAALATACALEGWTLAHRVFKPLPLLLAIVLAVSLALAQRESLQRRFYLLLAVAQLACVTGDVFLMFPGFFLPGLVSFLIGHLFYIVLFAQGVPWFSDRRALAATLSVGALIYVGLWFGGLPPALRLPVAAYVLVIGLMAAQAFARHRAVGERATLLVALGAVLFMVSDSLLATNRFVTPLPAAQLGVLGTYYAAQILIARYTQPIAGAIARLTPGASN